jgi:hypothetical protein
MPPTVPREAYDHLLDINRQLRLRLAEAEAECDQWQRKLTEDAWPELARLRDQVQVLTLANQTFTGTFEELVRLRAVLTRIMQGARSLEYARHLARMALDVDVAQQHQDEQHDQD